MTILYIALLSLVSALLYRMGGYGQEGRDRYPWLPGWAFNTKARDIGCALCVTGAWALVGVPFIWWAYLLSFLFLFGSLTTYWDEVFDYDNFYAHGLVAGLAAFPIAIVSGMWGLWMVRCILLALLMGVWSQLHGNDHAEELGRGFVLPATVLLWLC